MMTSADIVDELRAARPVAPLSLRAQVAALAESAPAAPARRRSWTVTSGRRAWLVALPAAAAVALASAGAIGLLESERDATIAAEVSPAEVSTAGAYGSTTESADAAAPADSTALGETAKASAPSPTTGRAQRVTASLTIRVADTDALSEATQEALATIRALGGHLVTVSYATTTEGSASLTLRVPTARVQEAITRLSSLGTIVAQQVQIEDLQEAIDALDRRIANLRTRIARLTAQLDEPGLDEQTRVTLQARRSDARAELAAARAARAGNAAEARFATIQLALVTDPETSGAPAPASRFDRWLDAAGDLLLWEAISVLYVLVVAGPFLLVAMAVWWGRRVVQRREQDRLLGASS
jgi:hypothetical protein